MDHEYSTGSFYDDEIAEDVQDDDDDQESVVQEEDDDEILQAGESKKKSSSSATSQQAAAKNNNSSNKPSSSAPPEPPVYCFTSDSNEATMPNSRTLQMKRRENDWFLVVYRDFRSLVEQFKLPDNTSTNGTYTVIDGRRFADSDALQIRLKRNCSLISTAAKSAEGDQYFSPKAVELMIPTLMPFVLSEELIFGCRSTWNTIVMCARNVIRRMKNPPRHYSLRKLFSHEDEKFSANNTDTPAGSSIDNDDDDDDENDAGSSSTPVTTSSNNSSNKSSHPHHALDHESGLDFDWKPLLTLCQKTVGATVIPGQAQAYELLLSLLLSMNRCVSSKTLTETWNFNRRHFIGYLTSACAARLIPTRILGRSGGAVDDASIKQQCETLTEMLEWIAASWKVPHTISNTEETFACLAHNLLSPVGVRLFEKNKKAFDEYVVPLRKRVLGILGPHLRVTLAARKTTSGKVAITSQWSVRLLAILITRDEEYGWSELIRWRRILEPSCSTKAQNSVPIRYLSELISVVNKDIQKRMLLLRNSTKATPSRETLNEVFPALEGDKLQKFIGLTVPLVADLAFNARLFGQYSYAMWLLNFMDPTPNTAARTLASVQVGMSEAGKETKQVTQALKILSDQLCAITSQTIYRISTSSDTDNSIHGKMWSELLPSSDFKGNAHTNAGGALKEATAEILASAKSPLDCAIKTTITFFNQALENMESTVEDRVNDALRCIYSLVIFGQCDHLPQETRRTLIRSFINKIEEKYFPVEAQLTATTAGILHFAFAATFRLVADDREETLRIIDLVKGMLEKPSIHETWSTCLRTLIAAILEQGCVRLFERTQKEQQEEAEGSTTTTTAPPTINDIKKHHADLLPWFCPLIEQIFNAAQIELANGLTTTTRFVGNVYVVCTLIEHLPAPVMTQLCLGRFKEFLYYLISWCQERAGDPQITEKGEADLRCAASSIQSILDCVVRSLFTPMPFDTTLITLSDDNNNNNNNNATTTSTSSSKAKIWQSTKDRTRYIEPSHADHLAARELVIEILNAARDHLSAIPKNAESIERALRCGVVGRMIGGVRGGTWSLNGMAKTFEECLDDEIAKSYCTNTSDYQQVVVSEDDANNTITTTKDGKSSSSSTAPVISDTEPTQSIPWWTCRFYDLDGVQDSKELTAPVTGTLGKERDLTDYDSELYMWLLQEMLGKFCTFKKTTEEKKMNNDDNNDTSPLKRQNTDGPLQEDSAEAATSSKSSSLLSEFPSGKFHENHPLHRIDSFVGVDDIPLPVYKTVMSLLEGNYSFDYTGLLNEILAPGDDAGREHFHYKLGAARTFLRNREKSGAFSRASSVWSSRFEAGSMLNLSFSKSVMMRRQAQSVLSGFIQMWVVSGTLSDIVDEVIQSLKQRVDMGNKGWLSRLSDVDCKATLYLVTELCGVLGRDHTYQLAEPLLSELCLGGELRRPSNERRKEGTIAHLISKLQSSSYGPPVDVCDRQIGRWLDYAKEAGRAPISITRCLRVALGYFRYNQKLSDRCSVNSVMRHECLSHVTEDHIQFLLSLTTQLHRATEHAWKILHNIGLIIARETHFIHTHLPRAGTEECEICPHVKFDDDHAKKTHDENEPWIPIEGPNHAITDCCPFTSNYLFPTASCSTLHRKSYTWGKVTGHTSDLAKSLGRAFLRPDFIRQCLDVHVALLRSEAIAGERSGRRTAVQRVQNSPLANAIEWSRFGRCALWVQISDAYENHTKGTYQGQSLCEIEMKALHTLAELWTGSVENILPHFDASGAAQTPPAGRSPRLAPSSTSLKPETVKDATNAQLDEALPPSVVPNKNTTESDKAAVAKTTEDAAEPTATHQPKQTTAEQQPQSVNEKHVDPSSANTTTAADAAAPPTTNPSSSPSTPIPAATPSQQQTSVICEYLAGNALCKGLFGAVQHLAYPVDKTNENVTTLRKKILKMIIDLFQESMFVPSVPHEAASLFLNSWGGFAGSLSIPEKEEVHEYLFKIVAQDHTIAESTNELVRRRAWQALRKSYGNPARGLWRQAILLEDAFLLDKLLNDELYNTAIDDPSRSVRAEANLTFRGLLESSVVSRIESFYDYKRVKNGFPVDEELLRSDEVARKIEAKLLDMRLTTLQQRDVTEKASSSSSKHVRAALSLISLVTAGVALEKVIPEIPNIATTLISVPSEAASANALTNLRRAPFDYESIRTILIVLIKSLQVEIEKAQQRNNNNNNSNSSSSAPVAEDHAADDTSSNISSAPTAAGGESSSVAQTMARVAPLVIYVRFLANSRYTNDLMEDKELANYTNILDILATAFTLPGRQLLSQVSLTISTWATVLPRESIRQFVIRSIKSLDAAAKIKDSMTMKVNIASLAAVVNAFAHTVPSFVPASLMRLVKYKNVITLSRDEREELERQEAAERKKKESSGEEEEDESTDTDDGADSTITTTTSSAIKKSEDYKSLATEGLQHWWAVHLQAWEQEHKSNFTEAQAQAISDACKARSYFV